MSQSTSSTTGLRFSDRDRPTLIRLAGSTLAVETDASDCPWTLSARGALCYPLPPASVLDRPIRSFLLVEEGEDDGGEQRRHAEVVVGQTGQDRQCVTAGRPALAHPAAVASATVEQGEDLDVVAGRRHIGVGGDHQRGHLQTAYLLGEVKVRGHRGAD